MITRIIMLEVEDYSERNAKRVATIDIGEAPDNVWQRSDTEYLKNFVVESQREPVGLHPHDKRIAAFRCSPSSSPVQLLKAALDALTT